MLPVSPYTDHNDDKLDANLWSVDILSHENHINIGVGGPESIHFITFAQFFCEVVHLRFLEKL